MWEGEEDLETFPESSATYNECKLFYSLMFFRVFSVFPADMQKTSTDQEPIVDTKKDPVSEKKSDINVVSAVDIVGRLELKDVSGTTPL